MVLGFWGVVGLLVLLRWQGWGFAVDGWCGELFEAEKGGCFTLPRAFKLFELRIGFSVLLWVSVVFRFGCGEAYG